VISVVSCWLKNLKERDSGKLGVHGTTVLNLILKEKDERVWTGFIWLRIGIRQIPMAARSKA
jgi:hypothetical protein